MTHRLFAIALAVAGLQGSAPASADVVALTPIKDNSIFSEAHGNSNGGGEHFFAGSNAAGAPRRGLLAFNVAGNLPPGSVVTAAQLTLHMSRAAMINSEPVSLHRLLADWGEGGSIGAMGEGGGAPADPGEATWSHRIFSTNLWASLGGDFVATASATTSVGNIGTYAWGSTPGMVADVQRWLERPDLSFGWIVIGNEIAFSTAKRFDSRQNSNPLLHPVLEVTFTPPTADADGPSGVLTLRLAGANPTLGTTEARFTLPTAGPARLAAYDVAGREIAVLASGPHAAGTHSASWNAPAGIFYLRLEFAGQTRTVRLISLR